MIASSIYANDDISKYPEKIQKAITYLKNGDFVNIDPGVYEIEGKEMFAQVFDTVTGPVSEKRPEAHKEYIDVQFLATGKECLGFAPYTEENEIDEYIEEKDLIFLKNAEGESFVNARPGNYTIFFPNDIHRPAVMADKPETIRKVIVKIKVG